MLVVVSPAKSLDFDSELPKLNTSQPIFLDQAAQLIDQLKQHTPDYFQSLMKISPKLAELNWQRFQQWQTPFTEDNARPAVFAFTGDVYQGLDVHSLDKAQLASLNERVRILSGLYGLLKPLDLMQAYRLEMGTKYQNKKGDNLYQFWQSQIADALNEELKGAPLVNLASNEYFKAVPKKALKSEIITPVFKDCKNGQYKIISFYAKKARGLMARYIVENNIDSIEQLKDFDLDGYYYSAEDSSGNTLVFKREEQ